MRQANIWVLGGLLFPVALALLLIQFSMKAAHAGQQVVQKAPTMTFGIAASSDPAENLVIPPANRIDPYEYGKVPNCGTEIPCYSFTPATNIQLIIACNRPSTRNSVCYDQNHNQGELVYADTWSVAHTQEFAARNPEVIWMVGNEPNNANEQYGDSLSVEEYADFFLEVATLLYAAFANKQVEGEPKLVFCQSANVAGTPDSWSYCDEAFAILAEEWNPTRENGLPANPEDAIYAVSTHFYLWTPDYNRCASDRWQTCFGNSLRKEHMADRHAELTGAETGLRGFERWVAGAQAGAYVTDELADKPLWLTEFGVTFPFCPGSLETPGEYDMQAGEHSAGGVGCPVTAFEGVNPRDPDYYVRGTIQDAIPQNDLLFFGRSNDEGIWGVQELFLEYLYHGAECRQSADPEAGCWEAAWWFLGAEIGAVDSGGIHDPRCNFATWLFGDDTDCLTRTDPRENNPSRTAWTLYNTIRCKEGEQAYCPQPFIDGPCLEQSADNCVFSSRDIYHSFPGEPPVELILHEGRFWEYAFAPAADFIASGYMISVARWYDIDYAGSPAAAPPCNAFAQIFAGKAAYECAFDAYSRYTDHWFSSGDEIEFITIGEYYFIYNFRDEAWTGNTLSSIPHYTGYPTPVCASDACRLDTHTFYEDPRGAGGYDNAWRELVTAGGNYHLFAEDEDYVVRIATGPLSKWYPEVCAGRFACSFDSLAIYADAGEGEPGQHITAYGKWWKYSLAEIPQLLSSGDLDAVNHYKPDPVCPPWPDPDYPACAPSISLTSPGTRINAMPQ